MTRHDPIAHRATSSTPSTCCQEYTGLSRRGFLGASMSVAGGGALLGSQVLNGQPAYAAGDSPVLVVLSMRGAHDGLSLAVPYGDPVYYQARPRIGIPSNTLLAKDGFFGLHPKLAPLMPMWNAGEMAVIHAAGLPTVNRSHFDAMEQLEDADAGSPARVGWLNRLVGTTGGESPLQGFFVGGGVAPTSVFGPAPTTAVQDIDAVTVAGDDWGPGRRASLHTLWDDDPTPLSRAMRTSVSIVDDFAPVQSTANNLSKYPDSDIAGVLSIAARLIRGNVGVQVITLDQGDWDMHTNVGTLNGGAMVSKADEFASAIKAFFNDLGAQRPNVTLLAFSEFGRRIAENANFGLDHGYGNAMWAFGAGVKGGRYYGSFPTLSNTLDADLLVTTDYRNVLADVVSSRFGASISTVFPDLDRRTVGFMS